MWIVSRDILSLIILVTFFHGQTLTDFPLQRDSLMTILNPDLFHTKVTVHGPVKGIL